MIITRDINNYNNFNYNSSLNMFLINCLQTTTLLLVVVLATAELDFGTFLMVSV